MSVPAWPIPIQNTKLTIANPQLTGLFTPQTPTPVINRYPTIAISTAVIAHEMPKATYHARGGLGRSTTRHTISVTDVKSWSPRTSGARRVGSSLVLSKTAVLILYAECPAAGRGEDGGPAGGAACVVGFRNFAR